MPARNVSKADETVSNSAEVLAFKTKAEKAEAARKVLFTIDDEEFSIPEKLDPILVMRFLNSMRIDGENFAVLTLMGQALGEEKLKRFLEWEDLTEEVFAQVQNMIVENLITGPSDSGK